MASIVEAMVSEYHVHQNVHYATVGKKPPCQIARRVALMGEEDVDLLLSCVVCAMPSSTHLERKFCSIKKLL